MTHSWEIIVGCLRAELSEYGQLLNLFNEQQDLIFKHKPEEVLRMAGKIETQIQLLDAVRLKRETVIKDFALSNGQSADSTLRSLIRFFTPEIRPLLEALITDVNVIIHRVRRSLKLNHRLLSSMVETHQEVLRRLKPDAFNITYSSSGRISVGSNRAILPVMLAAG
jgi:flagellar biosynthesis/type III secretory pathway chaperone